MAAKTGWHRYGTELRHCHPMYNQIKKSLLLSLQVKKFLKSVNRPIWQSYKQERDCVVHFLRLLAVCWPLRTK